MPSFLLTLGLGFILGIKHSFEPDHVIAVSTIASEQRKPFESVLIGALWGIGHTSTLFVIGILILLLKLQIPQKLSISFEGLVGVMLVILGMRVFMKIKKMQVESHVRKPNASFFVGLVHGLAGSGIMMLLVLSTTQSLLEGLYYILVFGLGSVLGMSSMSFMIGIPFFYSAGKLPKLEIYLKVSSGILSILFGLFVVFETLRVLF